MKLVVAKPEAVLGFMLFKGWKLVETNKMHYILHHPAMKDKKSKEVQFHIPKNDQAEDFSFQINNTVNHLARLYNWDKTLLLLFLSVKPEDIDTLFQEWLRSSLKEPSDANQSKRSIQVSFSMAS